MEEYKPNIFERFYWWLDHFFGWHRLNYKKAVRETKRVFNNIGIYAFSEICRCVGFAEDDEDYYWILKYGDKTHYASMVMGFKSLKPLYGKRQYKYLDNMMDEYWGAPREKEYINKKIR